MTSSPDHYSYGPYHDGPDPLAPPLDLSEALEEIGREVMEGSSPRNALEELLRRGLRRTAGLDEMTTRLWQRRSEIQRTHRLDGTLREVRELLDKALDAERRALFPDPSDDARFAEAQLDALPPGTAAAVSELAEYDWRSPEGREAYQQIQDLLGRELLDSRFAGMKQALENTTPQDVERVREMMSDLNDLLGKHAQGQDTEQDFRRLHGASTGSSSRRTRSNVEELIDALASRAAAAQRMMNSMTDGAARRTGRADQPGVRRSRGWPQELSALDAQPAVAATGRGLDGSGRRLRGKDPLGMGEGAQAMQDLAELDATGRTTRPVLSGRAP